MFAIAERSPAWLNDMATEHHYMHRPIHQRSYPFGWALSWNGEILRPDGRPNGFIMFATIHYTRLREEFGYEGLPTKWQVLSLARLWLHPDFQADGSMFSADILPGFYDRKMIFRSTLTSAFMRMCFEVVQKRWLEVHPPRFPDQPYHIVKIISYADTRYFEGKIYKAFGFRESGRTVSQKRHKNTRGSGLDGAELIRFIYDLPMPTWSWEPVQRELEVA